MSIVVALRLIAVGFQMLVIHINAPRYQGDLVPVRALPVERHASIS